MSTELVEAIGKHPALVNTAVVLGLYVLASFSYTLLKGIYARLLRSGYNTVKKYGKWAVVTGATDGIGKAMAMEFARKGHDVVLISRTQSKLEECVKEIKAKYSSCNVKTLDIDYGKFDESARKRVEELLSTLEVGVLVNNVGVSYPYARYFNELSDESVEALMTLNVNSTTWMTRIVLPGMLKNKKGSIVNIASAAGVNVSSLLAQYGAAKSYVLMFSKTLHYELKDKGIHVQCQVPLFVSTKLASIKNSSLTVPSPATYARAAVATIGYEVLVSPYWAHALQLTLLSWLPDWANAAITMLIHSDIRKRGQKKDKKKLDDAKSN